MSPGSDTRMTPSGVRSSRCCRRRCGSVAGSSKASPADVRAFVESLPARGCFDRAAPVVVTRAPGRLDVMGGIADYSGSLVLQRPIAEATLVALQPTVRPILEI